MSFFHSMRTKSTSPEDIFESMKPYLSPDDLESFDQMQNMMSMMSMMQEMQNMPDMNFDPMSMMTNMFTQEDDTNPKEEGDIDD